jgi:hypothetical protein
MKKLILLFVVSGFFISCEQTNKQSNTTKNPDTVVVKEDSAIKRTDTSGFNNK